MPDAGALFQQAFNRGVGGAFKRPMVAPKYQVVPRKYAIPSRSEIRRGVATGTVDLDTDVENAYEEALGEQAVGGGRADPNFLLEQQLDKYAKRRQRGLERDYQQKVKQIEREILETERIPSAVEQQQKAGIIDAIDKPSNPVSWIADKIASGVGKVLSRGQQGLLVGLNEMVQQPGGGKEPGWSDFTPQDIPGGIWSGLKGEKKTSGGEMMEMYFPSAPHPLKIAGGATIDLGADPLNWVGLGLAKKAVAGARAGKLLNEASIAKTTGEAITRALTSSGVDVGRHGPKITAARLNASALERTKNIILDLKGGGIKGRLNVGANIDYASTHALGAGTDLRNIRQGRFERMVETFRQHIDSVDNGGPKIISDAEMDRWKKIDPDFKMFHDNLPTGKVTHKGWKSEIDDAANKVRRTLDKDVETFQQHVMREVGESYQHTPALTVKFGGYAKQVKIPAIGKAMEVVSKTGTKMGLDTAAMRKLSHSGQFPGKLALIQQRGRSIGTQKLEAFKDEISEEAIKFTKTERKEIVQAIEGNRTLMHNPKLQSGIDFVKTHMKRMWDQEVEAGARSVDDAYVDNYTFVWNRKGNKDELFDFKDARKKKIHETGGASVGDYKIQNAKDKGFKPVEDAFDMLIRRQMKSNRDITRALFRSDLVDNYGQVVRGLDKSSIERQQLRRIANNKLADPVAARANKELGDSWYLSKEMNTVLKQFDEFSKFTTDPAVMKWFRKLTNFFKAGATVYNPGYHTRNMISDTIMGLMDGIGLGPYYELLRPSHVSFKRLPGEKFPRFHPKTGARIKIAKGWDMTMDELWNLFRSNASGGGYVSADFGAAQVTRGLSKVNEGVRNVSELREDFGRVAHFLGALRQEYKGSVRGFRNVTAAQDKAIEQAVYRVNHYKFDYGALTKWEQKWIKPAIPFYTFTRKAFPTVIENFMMNPKWAHRYQMMRESRDGDSAKNFSTFALPPWMRDVGYATIRDEKEPWLATFEGLPTNVFSSVIPTDLSAKGVMSNVMSNINPIPQMVAEVAQGEEYFSGKDINNYQEYILNKFGGPGAALKKGYEQSQKGMAPWQIALTSRLGAGLPFHKVSQEQQDYQSKVWEDYNIEGRETAPFNKFNAGEGEDKGLKIYTSKSDVTGMSSYRIRDTKTGKVVYQGNNPFEALEVARSQTGTPGLPVSLEDWNNTTGRANNLSVYWSDRKKGSSYRVRNTKSNKVLGDFKTPEEAYQLATMRAGG